MGRVVKDHSSYAPSSPNPRLAVFELDPLILVVPPLSLCILVFLVPPPPRSGGHDPTGRRWWFGCGHGGETTLSNDLRSIGWERRLHPSAPLSFSAGASGCRATGGGGVTATGPQPQFWLWIFNPFHSNLYKFSEFKKPKELRLNRCNTECNINTESIFVMLVLFS